MTLDKEEHKDKLIEIMKKEGTYFTYMRFMRRGVEHKTVAIVEDIINRYGQNLDGDLDKKFKTDEVLDIEEDDKNEIQQKKKK